MPSLRCRTRRWLPDSPEAQWLADNVPLVMLKSFLQPFQRQRRAPFGRRAYSVPVPPNKKVQLKPLDYLQPEHESVQGVSKETALAVGAGFSPRGITRTVRYPRAQYYGALLAYCWLT